MLKKGNTDRATESAETGKYIKISVSVSHWKNQYSRQKNTEEDPIF